MDQGWETEIGQRLRSAREKTGLSRPRVADLITAHVNTVIAWEKGEGDFWGQLPSLAKIYDVDLRWLLHGHEFQDGLAEISGKLDDVLSRLDVYVDATERTAIEVESEGQARRSEQDDDEAARGTRGRRRKAQ